MSLVGEKGGNTRPVLPEVQEAQVEFDKARLEALQKVNPKAEDMSRELEKVQEKIEKKRQSLRSAMKQAPQRKILKTTPSIPRLP